MFGDRTDVIFKGDAQISRRKTAHPWRDRAVPDERMSFDPHAVGLSVADDGIAGAEVVVVARVLDRVPLHLVLGGQIVEVSTEDAAVTPIRQQPGLHRRADELSRRARRIAKGSTCMPLGVSAGWGSSACSTMVRFLYRRRTERRV